MIAAILGAMWFAAASSDRRQEDAQLATLSQLEDRLAALRADTEAQRTETATLETQTAALRSTIQDAAADATSLDASVSDLEGRLRPIQVDMWRLYESMTAVVDVENRIAAAIEDAVSSGNQRQMDTVEATASRLQSSLLPDLTVAVEAVETSTRLLSLTLAATGAPFDVEEDFDPPTEGWRAGFSSNGSAESIDGAYAITAVDNGYLMWGLSPFDVADATLSVTATPVDGPEDGQFSYGIVCRSVQTDYLAGYWFAVDSAGTYQVGQFVPPGDFVDLVPRGRELYPPDPAALGDVINPGLAANRIDVVCDGRDLSLSINGTTVWEGSDDGLGDGTVALAAITYEDDPVTVRFDDLRLTGGGGPGEGGP